MSLQQGMYLALCPSLTVRNQLLMNKHEFTIRVCSGDHSWSFQSIPIHSNSVLLMRFGSAGKYQSFEHIQTFCVANANKFHFCLCALKCVVILFVAQLMCCILVILTVFLLYSGSNCILGDSYM